MKELRSKITAIALICLFSLSVASCADEKPVTTQTVVVTTSENENNNESKNNSNDSDDTNASTEAPIPENDDDGSKITVIEVTDSDGKTVTEAGGANVTEIAIVGKDGNVVTDAKGKNVPPNTQAVTTKNNDRIVETKATQSDNAPLNTALSGEETKKVDPIGVGPTLTIPDNIEAKAGDEVTFKISVTGNTGYVGLIAWLDLNSKYFEFVSYEGGDTDKSDYEFSPEYSNMSFNEYTKPNTKDIKTLICLYFDSSCTPLTGNTTFATITIKVKDNTPAGTYDLAFDPDTDGTSQCNSVEDDGSNGKKTVKLAPKYKNGTITVK